MISNASGGLSPARAASRLHWPIVVLIVTPIVLLAPIVMLGRVLYWGVPLLQFYPWQHFAVESLRSGQLPLWNSLVGSGAPLIANLQTGVFYPLNFLYLILPTEYAMDYTAALHVILAGLFMYAFMRSLRVTSFAALIAAISFQLCGFMIARLEFFSVTATFPWIAAWLWRTERLHQAVSDQRSVVSRQRSVIQNALWLALVVGLGVLAGHAQTAVYGLILISTYYLGRVISSSRHLVMLSLASFAIAVVLGLGLAAIQLLPTAELTHESQRAGGLDDLKVLTHSYWPPRLLTLLSPDFFGNPAQNNFWGYDNYWENAAYIGVLPLLLAMWMAWQEASSKVQAARDKKRRAGQRVSESASPTSSLQPPPSNLQLSIPFFASAVVVSLILAFGWFTPIYPFLYKVIPGFGLFQGPARWLIVTTAGLCVLAGLGVQRWLEHGFSRRAAQRWTLIGLALIIAGVAGLFIIKGQFTTFGPATLRLGILLIVSGWLFRSKIKNQKSEIIIVAVIALDLITAHFALNPALPPDIYHAPNPAAEAIKTDGRAGRAFYFDADEQAIKFGKYLAQDKKFIGYDPNDLGYWLGFRATLTPNAAMIDGVPMANNFDSLIIGRYQNLLDQINALPLDQALPLLSRMNVAYIVSPRPLNLPIVYRGDEVTIYRNVDVLPRAWIAPIDADLTQVSSVLPGSSIESLTDSGNAVTIRAASLVAGWLILADAYYPGWRAAIDGAPIEIQLANAAFRAVKLPAGSHQVEFRYEPQSVKVGEWITFACAAIVIVGLATTKTPRINESANDE